MKRKLPFYYLFKEDSQLNLGNKLPLRNERLKKLREKAKLTQADVAKAIDVTPKTYRTWEIGANIGCSDSKTYPFTRDIEKLEKLADLYGVSTDYILGRSDITQIDNDFIHSKIGISENSINALTNNLKEINRPHRERYIEMIDFLLAHDETKNLLQNMYYYFFGNYNQTWENRPSVDFYDENYIDGVSIPCHDIYIWFLSAITNAIPTIKSSIVNNNPIYKNYGKQHKSIEELQNDITKMEDFLDTIHQNRKEDNALQIMYRQLESLKRKGRDADETT